jgi:Cdc6-like AAA superfamily ATPase
MSPHSDEHAYASLTSPDSKRRKTSITSIMEDLDLASVSYNDQSMDSCDQVETPPTPNEMQSKAIAAAVRGDNLFLTGRAGTGKSFTIREIVKHFSSIGKMLHVTAPTGIAAINVNGVTINSWGCFGLGADCEYLANFHLVQQLH